MTQAIFAIKGWFVSQKAKVNCAITDSDIIRIKNHNSLALNNLDTAFEWYLEKGYLKKPENRSNVGKYQLTDLGFNFVFR